MNRASYNAALPFMINDPHWSVIADAIRLYYDELSEVATLCMLNMPHDHPAAHVVKHALVPYFASSYLCKLEGYLEHPAPTCVIRHNGKYISSYWLSQFQNLPGLCIHVRDYNGHCSLTIFNYPLVGEPTACRNVKLQNIFLLAPRAIVSDFHEKDRHFVCTEKYQLLGVRFTIRSNIHPSKRLAQAECSNLFLCFFNIIGWNKDLSLDGDVELNPGPITDDCLQRRDSCEEELMPDHPLPILVAPFVAPIVPPIVPVPLVPNLFAHLYPKTHFVYSFIFGFALTQFLQLFVPTYFAVPLCIVLSHFYQKFVPHIPYTYGIYVFHMSPTSPLLSLALFLVTWIVRNLLAEGIEPNPGPADINYSDDYYCTKSRGRRRHKSQSEFRTARILTEYHRIGQSCPGITGDLERDVQDFYQLIVQAGYTSSHVDLVPTVHIVRIFQQWIDGYGLMNFFKLARHLESGKAFETLPTPESSPALGADGRELLLKYFVKSPRVNSCPKLTKLLKILRFQYLTLPKFVGQAFSFTHHVKKAAQDVVDNALAPQFAKIQTFVDKIVGQISGGVKLTGALLLGLSVGIAILYFGWPTIQKMGSALFEYFAPHHSFVPITAQSEVEGQVGFGSQLIAAMSKLHVTEFAPWKSSYATHFVSNVKSVSKFTNALMSLGKFMTWLRDCVVDIMDSSWILLTGRAFFTTTQRVREYVTRVEKCLQICEKTSTSDMTHDQMREFIASYDFLLAHRTCTGALDKSLSRSVVQVIHNASPLYKKCVATVSWEEERPMPYWLYFRGAPSTYKTTVAKHVVKAVHLMLSRDQSYRSQLDMDSNSNLWYVRTADQDFWDGYAKQLACFWDDLFQSQVDGQQELDAFALIKARNTIKYGLHMADLAEKATTFFASPLIVSTTNILGKVEAAQIRTIKIYDHSAFLRRRDLVVELDPTEVPTDIKPYSEEALKHFIYIVYSVNPKTGETTLYKKFKGVEGFRYIVTHCATTMISNLALAKTSTRPADYASILGLEDPTPNTSLKTSSSSSTSSEPKKKEKKCKDLPLIIDSDDEDLGIGTGLKPDGADSETESTEVTGQVGNWLDRFLALANKISYCTSWLPRSLHPTYLPAVSEILNLQINSVTLAHSLIKSEQLSTGPGTFFSDPRWLDGTFQRYGVWIHTSYNPNTGFPEEVSTDTTCFTKILPRCNRLFSLMTDFSQSAPLPEHLKDAPAPIPTIPYVSLISPWYKHPLYPELKKYLANFHIAMMDFDEVKSMCGPRYPFPDVIASAYHDDVLNEHRYRSGEIPTLLTSALARCVVLVAVAGTLTSIAYAIATLMFGKEWKGQSGDKWINKKAREIARRAPQQLVIGQTSDAQLNSLRHIIYQNSWYCEMDYESLGTVHFHALGVGYDLFVTSRHNMYLGPRWTQIRCYPSDCPTNPQIIFPHNFLCSDNMDISKASAPEKELLRVLVDRDSLYFRVKRTNQLKSLKAHMMSEEDLSKFRSAECAVRFDKTKQGTDTLQSISPVTLTNRHANKPIPIVYKGVFQCRIQQTPIAGDCGRGYFWCNPSMPQKLIGHHSAGAGDLAIISPITKETFEVCLKFMIPDNWKQQYEKLHAEFELLDPQVHPDDAASVEVTGQIGIHYNLPVYYQIRKPHFSYPRQTCLVKSPLATGTYTKMAGKDVWLDPPYPDTHAPAALTKRGDLDPQVISMNGIDEKRLLDADQFADIRVWEGIFTDRMKDVNPQILTTPQAILGIIDWCNFHGIDLNTSSGFYYQMEGKKKHFVIRDPHDFSRLKPREKLRFVQIANNLWLDRRINDQINDWFTLALQKKMCPNVTILMLKDELRKLARVLACETRAFQAGQFVQLVACRRVFGDFVHVLEQCMDTDSALGINPYSAQWQQLYNALTTVGMKFHAHDTKKWDQNFQSVTFVDDFVCFYCHFYNIPPGDNLHFFVFTATYTTVFVFIIVDNLILFFVGMPSGTWATSLFNTICNSALNRSLFYNLPDWQKYSTPELTHAVHVVLNSINQPSFEFLRGTSYDTYFGLRCFGDDVVQAISKAGEFMTGPLVVALAKSMFAHTRTTASKALEIPDFETLEQVEFLKRQFVMENGICLCPLNKQSIITMVQFVKVSKDHDFDFMKQFSINCHVSISEAARYGREFFAEHKRRLNAFLQAVYPRGFITMEYVHYYSDIVARATRS